MKYLAIFFFFFLLSSCKPYYRYLHFYVYEKDTNEPIEEAKIGDYDLLINDTLFFVTTTITNADGFAKVTIRYGKQPSYWQPFKYSYFVKKAGYEEIYIDEKTKSTYLSSDSDEHIYVIDTVFLEKKNVEK